MPLLSKKPASSQTFPDLGIPKRVNSSGRWYYISTGKPFAPSAAPAAANVLREAFYDLAINVDQCDISLSQPCGEMTGWIRIVGNGQSGMAERFEFSRVRRDQGYEIARVHHVRHSRRNLRAAAHIFSPRDALALPREA